VNSLAIGNSSTSVVITGPGVTQQISGDLTNAGLLDIESSQTNGVIAYPTQHSSGRQNILLIEPDGTGRTQLTFDATPDLLPSWSPDGAQLAYVYLKSGSVSNISVINADGSNSHQIASQG
jgi:Tol biopolymer transport system component